MFFRSRFVKINPISNAPPALIPVARVFLNIISIAAATIKTAPAVPDSVIIFSGVVKNPQFFAIAAANSAAARSNELIKLIIVKHL